MPQVDMLLECLFRATIPQVRSSLRTVDMLLECLFRATIPQVRSSLGLVDMPT